MTEAKEGTLLWEPSEELKETANISHYMRWLEANKGLSFEGYHDLWEWSVADLEEFWVSIWEYFDVQTSKPYSEVLGSRQMPGAEWFPGAELNYAEHVFRNAEARPDEPAIMHQSEVRDLGTVTWQELHDQVAALAAGLRFLGVERGDRVGRLCPQYTGGYRSLSCCRLVRCYLVELFTGLRGRERRGPLRPDRTKGSHHRGWLPLRRQRFRPDRDRGAPPAGDAKPPENGALPVPQRRAGHEWPRRHGPLGRTALRERGSGPPVRASAIRPPAVGTLLLRHDRAPQGARARPRRHPARTPQRSSVCTWT